MNEGKETYWSQFASDYEEKQSYVVGKEVIDLAKHEITKEKNLGNVLELGCGTGLYTEVLQKLSNEILATDFSDEMLNVAIHNRSMLKNVSFVKANAMNLEFESKSFDTVFMANLIHIIEDPEKVIKESNRVLKNDGQMIITTFAVDKMSFFNKLAIAIRYGKAFGKPSNESLKVKTSKELIEAFICKNGFKIIKSKVLGTKGKAIYIKSTKTNDVE